MAYKVAIIDNDVEYSQELKKQIDKHYEDIKIEIFETLNEYKLKSQTKKDLVLVNSEIKTNLEETENAIIISEELKEDLKFFKYRKLECLVDDIKENLNYSSKKENEERKQEQGKTKNNIIILYSPYSEDISYKYANKVSNYLSETEKTFFLNLAMFSDSEEKYEKKGMNLIDAIYNTEYLNTKTFSKNIKIKNDNLNMFYPLENPYELLNINANEIECLINKISDLNYKNIVINTDSKIDEITLKIFENASIILIFYLNDRLKLNKCYNLFSSNDKFKDIRNKIIEIKHTSNEKKNFENIRRVITSV